MPAQVRIIHSTKNLDAHNSESYDTTDLLAVAEHWLRAHNIVFHRCTESHLKIAMGYGPDLNFWPYGRGTLYFDGAVRKEPERGLVGLESLLRKRGALK